MTDPIAGYVPRLLGRLRRLRTRYRKESEGATAIEFAIIALPFLGLIFGILELALVFFTSAVLTQSVSEAGRFVRIGAFQGCGQASEYKALLCNRMNNIMNCDANLRIDLTTATNFQAVTLPDPGNSGLDPDDDTADIEDGTYVETGPSDPVLLRATFYYPLILPNFMTRLENLSGSGRHVISVTTAFRNEPFPAGSTCDASLRTELGG